MPRVTAPVPKQLARSLNSAAAAAPRSSPLQNAGAVLTPEYAELLRNRRSSDHPDSSRGLATTHRPTPQPSIANRARPLMQTFHSSPSSSATPSKNLDATVLPSMDLLHSGATRSSDPSVPILPDNESAVHAAQTEAPVDTPEVTIVAADPAKVAPAKAFSKVDTVGLDGVELKFAHEAPSAPADDAHQGGMLKDMWTGMVNDVMGNTSSGKAA